MCRVCLVCVCVWARAIPDDVRAWARSGWLAERLRVGRHVCGQTLEIIVRACDGESACGTVFYERNHAPCIHYEYTEDTMLTLGLAALARAARARRTARAPYFD